MAKNLRTKINKDDTMYIHDVNPTITKQFVEEFKDLPVTAAETVKEVSENSVCPDPHTFDPPSSLLPDEFVFSKPL